MPDHFLEFGTLLEAHLDAVNKEWSSNIVAKGGAAYKGRPVAEVQTNNRMCLLAMIHYLKNKKSTTALDDFSSAIVSKRTTKGFHLSEVQHAIMLFKEAAQNMVQQARPEALQDYRDIMSDVTDASVASVATAYYSQLEKAPDYVDVIPDPLLFARAGKTEFDPAVFAGEGSVPGALVNNRYRVTKYIFSGAFGHGWVCLDMDEEEEDRKQLFMKTFKPGKNSSENRTKRISDNKELDLLERCMQNGFTNHPNIACIRAVLRNAPVSVQVNGKKGHIAAIITDFCNGGELYNYVIVGGRPKNFDERFARQLFSDLINGVFHMHGNHMFHRDLKIENLVVDGDDFAVKIMDFGFAKEVLPDPSTGQARATTMMLGTAAYQPPELSGGMKSYDPGPFDIWSCGMILFTLVGVQAIAASKDGWEFLRKAVLNHLLDPNDLENGVPANRKMWQKFEDPKLGRNRLSISPELKHLLNSIFDLNAARRITPRAILEHRWLKGEVPPAHELATEMLKRYPGIIASMANPEDKGVFRCSLGGQSGAAARDALVSALRETGEYSATAEDFMVIVSRLAVPSEFVVRFLDDGTLRAEWVQGTWSMWQSFVQVMDLTFNSGHMDTS